LPAIVDENVRQIETQVERLRNIASEFSLLGRDHLSDLGSLEVEPLLQEVRSLYPSFDGGWRIEVEAEPGLWVWASREALTKVLTNLVENARHAMGTKGEVHLQAVRTADRVRIAVLDEGPGIGPEVENRLFEPYFSTKNTGTGLGLVICRSLMEKMGGRISLQNRADTPGAEAVLELAPAPQTSDHPLAPDGNDSNPLA
jgi:signal transduction histidine kinase